MAERSDSLLFRALGVFTNLKLGLKELAILKVASESPKQLNLLYLLRTLATLGGAPTLIPKMERKLQATRLWSN